MRPRFGSQRGFTLIEMIMTLAVMGVLLGVGTMSLRPPAVRAASNSVQSFVQQARFEAIKTNRPVVVLIADDGRSLNAARASGAGVTSCAAATDRYKTLALSDYRGVTATSSALPLVWLPTGQPRACPAGSAPLALAGADLVLTGSGASATVHIGAGGEVAIK